jgi:hypothetical protein
MLGPIQFKINKRCDEENKKWIEEAKTANNTYKVI